MTTGADEGGNEVVGPGAFGAGIGPMPASWDLEADVVIIGAGATGLPAAIKAIAVAFACFSAARFVTIAVTVGLS